MLGLSLGWEVFGLKELRRFSILELPYLCATDHMLITVRHSSPPKPWPSPFPHTLVTLVTLVSLARDRLLRPIKTRGCLVWVLMAGCLLLVTPWNARSLGGSGACCLLLNVPELPVDGAGFVSYTVSPLHTNEFRSESLFIRPICF